MFVRDCNLRASLLRAFRGFQASGRVVADRRVVGRAGWGRRAPPCGGWISWTGPPWRLFTVLTLCMLAFANIQPAFTTSLTSDSNPHPTDTAAGPDFLAHTFRTNLSDYADGHVPMYGKFELAFEIGGATAMNPYFPYDPAPPPGVMPGTGITVDALLLPPGGTSWAQSRVLPCFAYQPVEETGSGDRIALLPVGDSDWRCRFTPDVVGTWRYKVRATDAGGTSESAERNFECAPSDRKGFLGVSETDSRFFEFADGTPFVTPLINVEQGSPFNTLADIRTNVRKMGENGVRFIRWFPTGEGANYFVAPYADTMRINWCFGDGWVTPDGVDTAAGKRFSYRPYYYSAQALTLLPNSQYRLRFRAQVTGDRVLRAQIGNLAGGILDVCSSTSTHHEASGETCTYRQDGWQDYETVVETGGSATTLGVALRGLYVSGDAPTPFDRAQDGTIRVHSVQFQRDETGNGDWGGNLLTRSDPDTYGYVDQQAAAKLDEVLQQSETYGVYHKLTLFHKNDSLLARFLPDGTVGDWDVNHFYAAEGQAARWYEKAYVRYFIARWSYSPAIHSLELANENHFDDRAQDAAFAIAQFVRDTSPRHILMSNSFWGWWVEDFWTDPERGHLMDYSDKHWYANESGSYCDDEGERCELISNVWDDSAAYVRECSRRFDEYRELFDYDKPIVRGEGGVVKASTESQDPGIALEPMGIYYHKKLWAHVGTLGDTCDGEWYPRLFLDEHDGLFPNFSCNLYKTFAAYERFMARESLANGNYVEIGTDLAGYRLIVVSKLVGDIRVWGVTDIVSYRTLLWIDNVAHTWKTVLASSLIPPASGTLNLSGFEPGRVYVVEWWDPYTSSLFAYSRSLVTSSLDGSLQLDVDELTRDVAVKIFSFKSYQYYLPLIIKQKNS